MVNDVQAVSDRTGRLPRGVHIPSAEWDSFVEWSLRELDALEAFQTHCATAHANNSTPHPGLYHTIVEINSELLRHTILHLVERVEGYRAVSRAIEWAEVRA